MWISKCIENIPKHIYMNGNKCSISHKENQSSRFDSKFTSSSVFSVFSSRLASSSSLNVNAVTWKRFPNFSKNLFFQSDTVSRSLRSLGLDCGYHHLTMLEARDGNYVGKLDRHCGREEGKFKNRKIHLLINRINLIDSIHHRLKAAESIVLGNAPGERVVMNIEIYTSSFCMRRNRNCILFSAFSYSPNHLIHRGVIDCLRCKVENFFWSVVEVIPN